MKRLLLCLAFGVSLCFATPLSAQSGGTDASVATSVATPEATTAPRTPPEAPIVSESSKTVAATKEIAGEQTWWQALIRDLVWIALDIFLPVLAVLLFWVMRKFGLKVELERMDQLAAKAKSFAEHKADQWFKEKGTKSSGAQKEDWAFEFIEALDTKMKLKAKASEKLRSLILAKIGEDDQASEARKLRDKAPAASAKPARA